MKKYVILIVIILIYIGFAFVSFNLFDNHTYLFIGDNIKWSYQNDVWVNAKVDNRIIRNSDLYNLYTGEYLGRYTINNNSNNLYIKKSKINELFDEQVLIYKGKQEIKIVPFEKEYTVSADEKNKLLDTIGMNKEGLVISAKIDIDLDSDGVEETIYEVYNSISFDSNITKYYSVVCIFDGIEYTILATETSDNQFYDTYSVLSIIDFTNDGNYEIILGKSSVTFGLDDTISMYGLQDGKYVELVSTK